MIHVKRERACAVNHFLLQQHMKSRQEDHEQTTLTVLLLMALQMLTVFGAQRGACLDTQAASPGTKKTASACCSLRLCCT